MWLLIITLCLCPIDSYYVNTVIQSKAVLFRDSIMYTIKSTKGKKHFVIEEYALSRSCICCLGGKITVYISLSIKEVKTEVCEI